VEQVMAIVVGVENFLLGAALDVSAPDVPIALDDDGDDRAATDDLRRAATDDLRRAVAAAPSGPERSLQAF
ncbi:hypothetical protein KFZ73_28140, partial [Tsukamurella paurometabola]|nr:hypothetical protein [Tsukamurella paurometabola]